MKKNNYYIIGGQYEYFCYGGAPTLIGAKRLANKHKEYWDNWQGWHTPKIYAADDCRPVTGFYGETIAPYRYAQPIE